MEEGCIGKQASEKCHVYPSPPEMRKDSSSMSLRLVYAVDGYGIKASPKLAKSPHYLRTAREQILVEPTFPEND